MVRGKPFLARLIPGGILRPKTRIPGGDIAGRIEAAGRQVEQFQPGDEVFGDIGGCGFGAFAEYVCVPEGVAASPFSGPGAGGLGWPDEHQAGEQGADGVVFALPCASPYGRARATSAAREADGVQPPSSP